MPAAPKMPLPWAAAEADVADVAALKALARGEASDDQQKRALNWIINNAAGTYDMSFHPGDARATDFSEGKRHVGRQIVGFLNINMESYKTATKPKQEQNGRYPRK